VLEHAGVHAAPNFRESMYVDKNERDRPIMEVNEIAMQAVLGRSVARRGTTRAPPAADAGGRRPLCRIFAVRPSRSRYCFRIICHKSLI
jgi:hypothetical protein